MPDTLNADDRPARPPADAKTVLITGAGGRIGGYFARSNADRYRLRLMDKPDNPGLRAMAHLGEVVEGDMLDLDFLRRATSGVDAVVHMAGEPSPGATWDSLLHTNIIGTYNVVAAAVGAGVKRFIFASSIHAVSGYPADVQVKTTEPVNPGDLYGVSKCFGEALARYVAEQEGMSAVAIRIGAFQPPENIAKEQGVTMMDAWVSPRDLDQLIRLAVDATGIKYVVVHGLSNNRFQRLDISTARDVLGYAPQDDSSETNAILKPLHLQEHRFEHSLKDSHDPAAVSGLRDELKPGSPV